LDREARGGRGPARAIDDDDVGATALTLDRMPKLIEAHIRQVGCPVTGDLEGGIALRAPPATGLHETCKGACAGVEVEGHHLQTLGEASAGDVSCERRLAGLVRVAGKRDHAPELGRPRPVAAPTRSVGKPGEAREEARMVDGPGEDLPLAIAQGNGPRPMAPVTGQQQRACCLAHARLALEEGERVEGAKAQIDDQKIVGRCTTGPPKLVVGGDSRDMVAVMLEGP
jgi:hypothetical protein